MRMPFANAKEIASAAIAARKVKVLLLEMGRKLAAATKRESANVARLVEVR